MTRKEILMLAILMAKETDDLIFLAYEIVDFLNEKEQEDEEEDEEDAGIEKKVMDAFGFTNPAKQFAEAAEQQKKHNLKNEFLKEPSEEEKEKRMTEIMRKIKLAQIADFATSNNIMRDGWHLEWGVKPAKSMVLHSREATKKLPEKNRSPWKKEDLDQLDEMLKAGSSFAEIAINLKRSEKAIQTVVKKLASGYPVGSKKTQ